MDDHTREPMRPRKDRRKRTTKPRKLRARKAAVKALVEKYTPGRSDCDCWFLRNSGMHYPDCNKGYRA